VGLIADSVCKTGGCFTEGYALTTHAVQAPPDQVVPLPAPALLLGAAPVALLGLRRRDARRRRPARFSRDEQPVPFHHHRRLPEPDHGGLRTLRESLDEGAARDG